MSDTHLWRSPPPHQTPLIEPGSLPNLMSPELSNSKELLHPSFLPPCQHGKDEGDMHAHAFDLLSLSQHSPAPKPSPLPTVVPSSVPVQSVLSATRPPAAASASGSAPKVRRMSSSTTGVLGRGKLAATGDSLGLGGVTKDVRPTLISSATSYSATSPIPNRKPVLSTTGTSPTPQLFDFAKTDRVKMTSRSVSSSMPSRSLPAHAEKDDMELEMAFDDEDDSASVDMDGEEGEEWKKLALGTGSGGVKGRRAGMVFKCENCGKEYRHPSCLIKHRWEHSPHWKEPTAISMSKHQQVQMLEAAAILAHLGPQQRKVLPTDRSLWPAILSPSDGRRPSMSSRDPSSVRSPPSSTAPLTPSSLRETSTLGELGRGGPQQRKSSPDSDSTTSSMGEGYVPTQTGVSPARPLGISRQISSQSSAPGPGTPQSFGSLPREMASFHINNSYKDARLLNGGPGLSPSGVSPIPHRSMGMSPSLKSRTGLVGGGMFGAIHTVRPSSSVRSGAMGDDEDEGISEREARGKSSSEEAEDRRKAGDGEDWGMAMEMEL